MEQSRKMIIPNEVWRTKFSNIRRKYLKNKKSIKELKYDKKYKEE